MSVFVHTGKRNIVFQPYGRAELKNALRKNLTHALVASIFIHMTIVGSYYLKEQLLTDENEAPMIKVRLMKYSELGPPPSIMNTEQLPIVGVKVSGAKPTIGIPVPVPDIEVSPEQTIATQSELSQIQSPVAAEAGNNSATVVQQDIKIEEEDEPAFDAFIPVEKPPIPVKQVVPEYPEIARRTGVEGSVWVKVLVTKEGKVKKAVVLKSDIELLNESAIQAAMQWVFTPAVMNNGPVSVWVAIPFRFRLHNQSI
jgi:protein TonB